MPNMTDCGPCVWCEFYEGPDEEKDEKGNDTLGHCCFEVFFPSSIINNNFQNNRKKMRGWIDGTECRTFVLFM